MYNSKLYFCIGLPRSSKSTQCRKWLNYENFIEDGQFKNSEVKFHIAPAQKRVVVSGDEIRQALYGSNWNSLCEDYVDSIKYTMVRALLNSGHTVLLDETNTSERSIRKILEIEINAEFAFVDTKPEECHRRADESAGPYAKSLVHKPIDRMTQNLTDLAYQYAWEDVVMIPDWLHRKDVQLIVHCIRERLIQFKKDFTNEPIRENSKLSKVPPLPTDSCPSFTYSGSLSPDQPTYQVW